MASTYPAQIDSVITLPSAIDQQTPINAVSVNQLRDAIVNIETTLGVNPQSIYGNVATRLTVLEAIVHGGGGGGTNIPTRIALVAGNQSVSGTTYITIGGASIDMSLYPATASSLTRYMYFGCDFYVPVSTDTASIQLWDATDGVVITGATSTTTSTTAARFLSSALTVGTSNGNIRTDVIAQYQVQLAMTAGSTTDKAVCYSAYLLIKYQ